MILGPLTPLINSISDTPLNQLIETIDFEYPWLELGESCLILGKKSILEDHSESIPEPIRSFLKYLMLSEGCNRKEALNNLLLLVRRGEHKSPLIEARLRLERALIFLEEGEKEKAVEEAEWAETRLSVISKGTRHHSIGVLVRLAILNSVGDVFRALHLCGEVRRDGQHDPWAVGRTRLEAGKILAQHGRIEESLRVGWIAMCLLNGTNDKDGARESVQLLLDINHGEEVGDSKYRMVKRTGLDLSWRFGSSFTVKSSSASVLKNGNKSLHRDDLRNIIDRFR